MGSIPGLRYGFDPWVGKIFWRTARQPTPLFLPEEPHGQRSLAGYSPQRRTESDMTKATQHTHTRNSKPQNTSLVTLPPNLHSIAIQCRLIDRSCSFTIFWLPLLQMRILAFSFFLFFNTESYNLFKHFSFFFLPQSSGILQDVFKCHLFSHQADLELGPFNRWH